MVHDNSRLFNLFSLRPRNAKEDKFEVLAIPTALIVLILIILLICKHANKTPCCKHNQRRFSNTREYDYALL